MFFPSRNIFFMLKFFPLLAYKMSFISYFVMELFFIFLLKYKVIFFIFFFIHLNVLRFCIPFLTCNFFFFSNDFFSLFLLGSMSSRPHFFLYRLFHVSFVMTKCLLFWPKNFLLRNFFISSFPAPFLGPFTFQTDRTRILSFSFYKQISQTWTTYNQETCMCGGILEIETILKNNYVCSPQRLLHLELGERTRFLLTTVKESFRFCFLYLYFSLV